MPSMDRKEQVTKKEAIDICFFLHIK
jgi:hypothetical protein